VTSRLACGRWSFHKFFHFYRSDWDEKSWTLSVEWDRPSSTGTARRSSQSWPRRGSYNCSTQSGITRRISKRSSARNQCFINFFFFIIQYPSCYSHHLSLARIFQHILTFVNKTQIYLYTTSSTMKEDHATSIRPGVDLIKLFRCKYISDKHCVIS